jgi:hypothetical protein
MQRLMMEVGPTGRLSHTHLWNTWPHEVTAAVCAQFEELWRKKTRPLRIQGMHLLPYLFKRNVACIAVAAHRMVLSMESK